MTSDVELDRALAAVTATLNDQGLEHFDAKRVQAMVDESLGGAPKLIVDDGGGLHDETGARRGAIRRMPSGEWITDPQNEAAPGSDAAIPSRPPEGRQGLLGKLKKLGS